MKTKKEVELTIEQILLNKAIADAGLWIPRDRFNSVIYDVVNVLSSDGNLRFDKEEDEVVPLWYSSKVLCQVLSNILQKTNNCSNMELRLRSDCSVYIGNIGAPDSYSLYAESASYTDLNYILISEIMNNINMLTK